MGWRKDLHYDWTQIALGCLYFILLLISVWCMLRQKTRWKLTWQRMFHVIIFLGSLTRSVFFLFQPWVLEGDIRIPNQVNIILNTLPTFLFFSTYLLLIFLWAELVHKTRYIQNVRKVDSNPPGGGPSKDLTPSSQGYNQLRSLRPIYMGLNVLLFTGLAVLFILDNTVYSPQYSSQPTLNNDIEKAIWYYTAFLSLSTALAFLIYGLVLIHSLMQGSSWKFMPEPKKKALLKVALISTLCTLAFGVRATMDILEVSVAAFQTSWWLNGLLWITLEYIPLLLILYILTGRDRPKSIDIPSVVEEGSHHHQPRRGPPTSSKSAPQRYRWPRLGYNKVPGGGDDEIYDDGSDFTSSPSLSPSSSSPFSSYGSVPRSGRSPLNIQGQQPVNV